MAGKPSPSLSPCPWLPRPHAHPGTARAAPLALALLLALEGGAMAQQDDFLPDNQGWNGLSTLDAMTRASGRAIALRESLDLSRLPARSAVLALHPTAELDPAAVMAYLERGGTLLLGDDFGRADGLLKLMGIQRVEGAAVQADSLHNGNPNLPVAGVFAPGDPLVQGLSGVVANHPAYFLSRLPTLLGFAGGRQQLLVSARVGKGHVVALSDPSVLINTMMHIPGNRRLAGNLAALLARAGDGPIRLLTGESRLAAGRGEAPAAEDVPGDRASAATAFLTEFNQWLGDLNDYALVEAGIRALVLMLGALGLVGLFLLLPLPRRDMDGHWTRAAGSDSPGVEEEVERFGGLRGKGNSAYPALLLREEVEEHLGQLLQAPGPLSTVHPAWVVEKVRGLGGEEAARTCGRLLVALQRIPHASSRAEQPLLTGVSRRELRYLFRESRNLFSLLGSTLLAEGAPESRDADH